ncbi:MAG: hypothetical protein ABI675_26860 [Chitinophagaceae bacterium]
MRCKSSILLFIAFSLLSSASSNGHTKFPGKGDHSFTTSNEKANLYSEELNKVLTERKATNFVLGRSQRGRNVEAFFFPGTSNKRALIIGGVHGSELSSIEVAKQLLKIITPADILFYNVIIIPSLFPDNAEVAKQLPSQIGGVENIGRYSFPGAVDPNRQMPTPGMAFDEDEALDHAGRKIENENSFLLDLIDQYRPQRIVNLHAIRDTTNAGVFADPRTDDKSIALGYETDSSLAIAIAKDIQLNGGYIPGNHLDKKPSALYYKDPLAVPAGCFQKRNFSGSSLPDKRGGGVSLGTWASTAVADETNPSKNREAMRILTMEFPGSKRPSDYTLKDEQAFYQQNIELYAAALKNIFLNQYFIEEIKTE